MKRLTFLIIIAGLLPFISSYHLGGTETMCWSKDMITGVQVIFEVCPPEFHSEWIIPPPESSNAHAPITPTCSWRVTINLPMLLNASGFPSNSTPHSNLHSCNTAEVAFCTPNIKTTPGLNTQTSAQSGKFVDGVIDFTSLLLLPLGNASIRTTWTVIAHTYGLIFSYYY